MPNLPYISPDLIKTYQEEIAKHSSQATVKRKSISLNRFFDWAKEEGHVDENPFTVSQNQTIISPKIKGSRNVKARTWVVVGITTGLLILIFLLTWKLQLPIPFIKYFAQEINTTNTLTTQVITQSPSPIPANSAVVASWNLYAKLRITDSGGNPVAGAQTVNFKLFNQANGGDSLYTSPSQTVTTDANGSVLISLDQVPTDLFFQNNTLYLEPEIGASASASGTITRIPISTANTAANLGGYFPANPTTGAEPGTVPVIDSTGSLSIASQSPAIKATEGNLLIEGQAVTIKSAFGSGGNIEINPDANGYAHFLFEGNKGNFLNAQAPNLTTGSLYYGMVPNNATGYYLINLQSGAPKMTTKFSVDAVGNTNQTGNLSTTGTERLSSAGALQNITGYSQNSGDFTINQNPGDFVSINKTLTSGGALSDVMTLTLDERGKPATQNSDYSTLVLNRYDGSSSAAALKVNAGNAIFNGQLQLGRFSSLPGAIGQGSLVFNTSDNKVYVWDGTNWVAVGTGGGGSSAFDAITSGINTSAIMVVGTGASLDFTGTGTINASNITCAGCIDNTKLADSAITINSSGILTGGGTVSLGGTLNLTATEADTLDSVTGRGATTTNDITVGNLTSTGTTTFGGIAYTWPGTQPSNYILSTDGSGTLSWVDPNVVSAGTNYWNLASGALFPNNNTVDLLIGGNATTSAKFAFTGVDGGLPTASISGTTAATFIDGNGNISTTNRNNLTLGNSSANNTTGNILLNPNGTGNVGIGTANPSWMLHLIQTDAAGTVDNYRAADFILSRTVGDSGGPKNTVDLNVNSQYSGTGTNYSSAAVQATVDNLSTGTITEANGVKAAASNDSTGTINYGRGLYAQVANAATGTIDNAQGVFIASGWNYNGGTITNNYGLYIENQDSGTNNYSIYSAGGKSYFAGNIGIGTTSPTATLDVAGNASVSGTLAFRNGTGTIQTTAFNPLVIGGNTTGNITLSPSNDTAGGYIGPNITDVTDLGTLPVEFRNIYGQALYQNGIAVCDALGNNCPPGSVNYWDQASGALYPLNNSVDLLIGSDSTASAKFAFTGVSGGTPTVSIAGTTPGVSTFIDGNGNISTTNNQDLTLGNSSTYSSTGNILLNPNGTGNVGIWTTTPAHALDVMGQIRSSDYAYLGGTDTTGLRISGSDNSNTIWQDSGALAINTNGGNLSLGYGNSVEALTILGTNGNVGIGTSSPTALLDVAGNASVSGTLAFEAGTGTIQTTNFSNLVIGGDTTGNITLSPSNNTAGGYIGPNITDVTDLGTPSVEFRNIYGQALYQNGVAVCDVNGNGCPASVNYWDQASGALYPINNSVDLLIGATSGSSATTSAKFAFTGVSGGVPTASIAGTLANVATFIDGNGNISTTNRQDLVLGSSTTYDLTGNILLNPNGAANVGIGTTNPGELLSLGLPGTTRGVLSLAGNTSGKVIVQPAAAAGNWTLTLPTNAGSPSELLTTDGFGVTSWQPVPTASDLVYYFQDTSSDVATYKKQIITPYTPKTTLSTPGIGTGNTILQNWITAPGSPGLTAIPAGQFQLHVHAAQTAGSDPVQIYAELWEADSVGGDIAKIGTTEISSDLTGSEAEYNLFFTTANTYTLTSSTSRIVTRVFATTAGAGPDTVDIYYGDEADSHISLPSQTVDASNFVPYVGATANVDLGIYDLSGATLNGTTGINTGAGSGTQRIDAIGNLVNIGNITGTGAITVTPAAGSNLNIALSGTGDFAVNTNQLYVDTSTGFVGIGKSEPLFNLDVAGNASASGTLSLGPMLQVDAGTCDISSAGKEYYDATQNKYYFCNGVSWTPMGSGSAVSNWTLDDLNGVIYPISQTVDVLFGGTATNTARFAFTGVDAGGTPTASISAYPSANSTFITATGNLGTTNAQDLTLGGEFTGNVIINSRNSNALIANGADLSIPTGTLTFPNSNTLTGVTDYLQLSQGISVGNGVTYYFDKNGDINAANLTVNGTTGITSTGVGAGLTFASGGGTHLITASAGTLEFGAATLTGTVTGNAQNITDLGTLDFGTGNVQISGPNVGLTTNTGLLALTDNLLTVNGGATVTGDASVSGNTTLGTTSANTVTFNAFVNSNIIPSANNTYDLGAATTGQWNNIYGNTIQGVNIFQGANQVCDEGNNHCPAGLWQQTLGALYPLNNSVDLLIGATSGSSATTSAKFAFTGVSGGVPTASIAGTLANVATFIDGNGNISTTNRNNLTIGNSSLNDYTGNILLNPFGNGNIGIGLATPGERLDISGNVQFSGALMPGSTAGITGQFLTSAGPGLAPTWTTPIAVTTVPWSGLTDPAANLTLNMSSYTSQFSWTGGGIFAFDNNGNVGIGTTSPTAALDVAGNASVSGTLAFRAGTGTIQTTNFSNLVIGGNTTGNITLNPSNAVAGGNVSPATTGVTDLGTSSLLYRNIYGTTIYQGANQVCDSSGTGCIGNGGGFWAQSSGALYPLNNIVDVLFGATAGATATSSAKFAFTGINGGIPTASVSGTTNVATFIDGNGNISSTNRNNLTLGNSSTYNTTGNILLNPNGTGYVGIGTVSPTSTLSVLGNISDLGSATISASYAGGIPLVAMGAASQTADLFEAQNSTGTPQVSIDPSGNLTTNGNINDNGGSLNTNQLTANVFNSTATTVNIGGGATTAINIGPTGANGNINLSGGSGDTGCTLDGTMGNFTCSGSITTTGSSAGFWGQSLGALYPLNNTEDVLFGATAGSTATSSAKFAFTGINTGGTPTASIAGSLASLATYLTGDGNLATTNMGNLVLGGISTGNIWFAAGSAIPGMVLTTAGTVGIGTTSPLSTLSVIDSSTNSTGHAALLVDQYESQDILTASASGTTKMTLANDGTLSLYNAVSTIDNTTGNITITPASNLIISQGNVGIDTVTPNAALQVGGGTNTHTLGAGSAFITNNLELDSTLFLDGGQIANSNGTAVMVLSSAPTTTPNYLSAGSWEIDNTANVGRAALTVNQLKSGDIFTASASGVPKFVISNTGNVGIGTTTPQSKLDIGNSTSTITNTSGDLTLSATSGNVSLNSGTLTNLLKVTASSGTAAAPAYSFSSDTHSGMYSGAAGTSVLGLATAGTARLTIDSSGNVGIGTINPLATLDVRGPGIFINNSGNATAAPIASNSAEFNVSANSLVTVGESVYGNANPAITLYRTAAGFRSGNGVRIYEPDSSGDLQFQIANQTNIAYGQENYKTIMALQLSGKVGIGTTSPQDILDVNGPASVTSFTGLNNLGLMVRGSTATTDYSGIDFSGDNQGIPEARIGVLSTGLGTYIQFGTSNSYVSGITNTAMTIDYAGKVGIGTAAPLSMLSVGGVGNALATITGQTATAGDYGIDGVNTGANGIGTLGWSSGTTSFGVYAENDNSAAGNYGIFCYSGLAAGCGGNRAWTNTSDARLKTDVVTIPDALDKVMHLRGVDFNWIDGGGADMGFIAQEVLPYVPEVVSLDPTTGMYSMRTSQLTGLLVEAVKDQQGQIASLSGQIANLTLTDAGDLNISQDNTGNYQVTNTTNNSVINQITGLAQLVAANIKSGAIATTDFIAQNVNAGAVIAENITTNSFTAFQGTIDNLLIKSGLVTPYIQVALISPLPGSNDVTVQIGTASESGQFVIQNASGSAVASIDNLGNATFSGQLAANGATISGTLYADDIKSKSLDDIQALLTQVQTDQNLLNQAANWNINTATDSASINNLAVSNLYITNQAAINSLSVTTNFSLGTDFVFGASNNSIDTLSAPLRIQSLAMAPVEIMDGLVTIDTQGNVNIAGDLFVAGRINSSGLTLSAVNTPQSATNSADLLTLKDTNGNEVSSINASGSAQFNSLSTQGLTIAGAIDASASAEFNGVITTNATAGTGIIPTGISEVTINNPKVTDYTLVYVTPTSTTENYVLYVKSKQNGQFTVGFTNPIDVDVNFNWWIVQVSQ